MACYGVYYRKRLKNPFEAEPTPTRNDVLHSSRYQFLLWVYEPSLDAAFKALNVDGLNPLATPEWQKRLKRLGVDHTSMSVGDCLQANDGVFEVQMLGWKKLESE